MNKRFRELAKEARLLTGWVVGEYEYQKFAELIVRECAQVADEVYFEPGRGMKYFSSRIKEHFGVEE